MEGTIFDAWQTDNQLVNSLGHGLGQFFHWLGTGFIVSPGAGGTAVLIAAIIAARQVRLTRESDATAKKIEGLWTRFEWVIDRSTEQEGKPPVLSSRQSQVITDSIKREAETLGDSHMGDLIRTYQNKSLSRFSERVLPPAPIKPVPAEPLRKTQGSATSGRSRKGRRRGGRG